MTTEELETLIDTTFDDDFLKFNDIPVEQRLSTRPDLHAFLMLDKLVPGTSDMVAGAAHDEIFLTVDMDDLAAVVTPDIVRDLVRCGVRVSNEGLAMFV